VCVALFDSTDVGESLPLFLLRSRGFLKSVPRNTYPQNERNESLTCHLAPFPLEKHTQKTKNKKGRVEKKGVRGGKKKEKRGEKKRKRDRKGERKKENGRDGFRGIEERGYGEEGRTSYQ